MEKFYADYVLKFYESDSKKVQDGTQRLIKKVTEILVESDFNEMEKLLNACKVMRYQTQGYLEDSPVDDEEKNMLTNIGYTRALVDIMQMYKEKVCLQYEIQRVNTKYRDILLRILAERGTLLHKDLAVALGVSASGLNAIIKQMNSTSVKLVNVEEISKYKMYSITAVALKYIKNSYRKNKVREDTTTQLGRFLRYYYSLMIFDEDKYLNIRMENEYKSESKEISDVLDNTSQKFGNCEETVKNNLVDFDDFKQKHREDEENDKYRAVEFADYQIGRKLERVFR